VISAQFLTDATAATMSATFDQFSEIIAIFDDRPSGAWRVHKLHKFYWRL